MNTHLEKLKLALATAIAGMSEAQMEWHPEGKWSATQVLEHLSLSYSGTVKGFERVAEAGKPLATAATWSKRWRTLLVTGIGYFPKGRKSPAMVEPRGLPAEKVRAEIGTRIAAMDEVITRCEGKFGRSTYLLDHPILGPFTAGEWRKFHLVHGLHHVKQIERLRQGSLIAK